MNIVGKAHIVIEKNSNQFEFVMPIGVSYADCYNAAHEVLTTILELMQESVKKMEAPKQDQADIKDEVKS